MNLQNNRKWLNYNVLAFLVPFLVMSVAIFLMALRTEHGSSNEFSMLKSDSFHQYFPFFKAFRANLLEGNSLIYGWDVGMGIDYLGLIAYYLGSPLNLLSVLVPEKWLVSFFTMLTPIRMGFAGMFFSVFLKKVFHKNDFSIVIFSAFYAFCAWVLGYMWNIMWMDTFALLPLVILGMISLLRDRKFILYTVALFFSILINYYIGFFTCIFTLLAFICYQICHWENGKKFWIDFCLMGVFTLLAVGMTAFLSLPTLASLSTTNSGNADLVREFTPNDATQAVLESLIRGAMGLVFPGLESGSELYTQRYDSIYNILCYLRGIVHALGNTFLIVPVVVGGAILLFKKRRFVLYALSLLIAFFVNYYVGIFAGIASLIAFVVYCIIRRPCIRKLLVDLGIFLLCTAGAVGVSLLLSYTPLHIFQVISFGSEEGFEALKLNIPTSSQLSDIRTRADQWVQTLFPFLEESSAAYNRLYTFLLNQMSLFDGMKQVATNNFGFTMPNYVASEGLPNIYCGVFTNLFAFLFLTCRQVKWRERICGIMMLVIINLSFLLRQLDFVWHGFHFPNMIPYRFSFVYSFVMLYLAYRVWTLRHQLRIWQVLVSCGLCAVLLFGSNAYAEVSPELTSAAFWRDIGGALTSMNFGKLADLAKVESIFPFANLFLLLLYSGVMFIFCMPVPDGKFLRKKQIAVIALFSIMAFELVANLGLFSIQYGMVNVRNYPKGTEDTEKIVGIMEELEEDSLFYRAETTHLQTYNDGALIGYNGITTFTSSANASVTNFMRALGYAGYSTWNRYAFEEGSPLANMFLNLKYMIERDDAVENNPYFDDIHHSGKVHLLENNIYLPLGFMTDPALADLKFEVSNESGTRYEFQNKLLSAALGKQVTPWTTIIGEEYLHISSTDNVTLSDIKTTGKCNYRSNANGGSVFFTYTFDQEGFFCLFYNLPKRNDITVSYDDGNGYQTLFTETYSLPYVMAACQVNPGDRIQVTLKCDPNESSSMTVYGGLLDEAIVRDAYEALSRYPLELTAFEDTFIEGTVNCAENGLLYTSIPQNNDFWHIYVDGEEAEITLIGDAMLGVMLEKGRHTITFRYRNDAFIRGVCVSLLSLFLFVILCWLFRFGGAQRIKPYWNRILSRLRNP